MTTILILIITFLVNCNHLNAMTSDVECTSETEESLIEYYSQNKLNQVEGIYKPYKQHQSNYYKLGVKKQRDKYIAIILESESGSIWNKGEIKAYFEPTSVKDNYIVQCYNADKTSYETLATMENGSIISIDRELSFNRAMYGPIRYIKMEIPIEEFSFDKYIDDYIPIETEQSNDDSITFEDVLRASKPAIIKKPVSDPYEGKYNYDIQLTNWRQEKPKLKPRWWEIAKKSLITGCAQLEDFVGILLVWVGIKDFGNDIRAHSSAVIKDSYIPELYKEFELSDLRTINFYLTKGVIVIPSLMVLTPFFFTGGAGDSFQRDRFIKK